MRHSNREEQEFEYQEELQELRQAKKLRAMRGNNYDDDEEVKKQKPRLIKLPCCFVMILVMALAVYIVYYVYGQIKDPLYKEWLRNKDTIMEVPQTLQHVGEEAKETFDDGKELFDQVEETKEQAAEVKQDIENTVDYTKDYLE